MLDVGIKETTATTGTGTVTLSAVSGFVRVADAFNVGDVASYCLISGNGDKEWGIGRAQTGNTFDRTIISATLVGSTYTRGGSAISLTGDSTLIVTPHIDSPAGGGQFKINAYGLAQDICPYIGSGNQVTTAAAVGGIVTFIPWSVSHPAKWSQIGINCSVAGGAGSSVVVGVAESLWGSDGSCRPGRNMIQSADLDTSTTGYKIHSGLSFRPVVGRVYWSWMRPTANSTYQALANGMGNNVLGLQQGSSYVMDALNVGYSAVESDWSGKSLNNSSFRPVIIFRP